jgi:hypothetical protein
MAEPYQMLTFNGGEVGRSALVRVDLATAARWAETAENVLFDTLGNMSKAPGTLFLQETPASAVTVLRPFIFSAEVSLVLEMSAQTMRFISGSTYLSSLATTTTNGGFADESGAPAAGGGAAPGEGSGGIGDPIGGGSGGGNYPDITYYIDGAIP